MERFAGTFNVDRVRKLSNEERVVLIACGARERSQWELIDEEFIELHLIIGGYSWYELTNVELIKDIFYQNCAVGRTDSDDERPIVARVAARQSVIGLGSADALEEIDILLTDAIECFDDPEKKSEAKNHYAEWQALAEASLPIDDGEAPGANA